jgi:hypothetical protein
MPSTDALPVPRKGAAYRVYLAVFDTSGKLVTGGLTGATLQISKDGNSFSAPGGSPAFTEIGTTGCGYSELNSTDMTADHVKVRLTVSNTNAVDTVVDLYPEEVGDIRVNVTQLNSDAGLIAKFVAAVTANQLVTLTSSQSATDLVTSAPNVNATDRWKGCLLIMLTGSLAGKRTYVTASGYSAPNGTLTVQAMGATPSAGDTGILL